MSAQGAAQPRYRGPAAIGDDLRRFWSLTYMLAATDFKLRFFGSALGYLWTLARPLLLFGTLYFVFTKIVKFGEGVKYYPVYLLSGIVLFTFFSETTSRGVTALIERENLLRKMRFPRMVIPLSVALHSLFNLGLNLIVVFIFIFASGITPTLDWLQIPLLIGMLVIFATGVTMLLSALYVRFRDVEPIWEVALQLLFYGSPIIYVIDRGARERARAGHVQPDRVDSHPVAPRGDRPGRTDGRNSHRRDRAARGAGADLGHRAGRSAGGSSRAKRRGSPRICSRGRWRRQTRPRRFDGAWTPSSARRTSERRAPTPRSRRPRTAPIGSTAGTSISTRSCAAGARASFAPGCARRVRSTARSTTRAGACRSS